MILRNPVLTGFNPDPCMIYVDKTYYLAVSTFEWFPGVLIYSSADLISWEITDYPLKNLSQLNMKGVDSSGGIWAPALSHSNGLFYLVYTNVTSSRHGAFRDGHNYYVTTSSIESGNWSEPVYLNSGGFDPSIFHENDGSKWVLNTRWNYRYYDDPVKQNILTGIDLQQLDIEKKELTGPVYYIFKGTDLKYTEAPHLYKIGKWYYLLVAEGGTSYNHSVSCARSGSLKGPYELHPSNPLLSSADQPNNPIQKAGHASLCQGHDGRWYLPHLCARPIGQQLGKTLGSIPQSDVFIAGKNRDYRCILGRETSIQIVEWKEDWPYLAQKGRAPSEFIEIPGDGIQKTNRTIYTHFNESVLPKEFQTLRLPADPSIFNLTDNKGFLTLRGCDSPGSRHMQTVLGIRQYDFSFKAETSVEFDPENLQQLAGIMYRYNEDTFYYINITYNERLAKKVVNLMILDNGEINIEHERAILNKSVFMKIEVHIDKVMFYYSLNDREWIALGKNYDATIISDEYMKPYYGFTGAFICLACHDWSGRKKAALFDYFKYSSI